MKKSIYYEENHSEMIKDLDSYMMNQSFENFKNLSNRYKEEFQIDYENQKEENQNLSFDEYLEELFKMIQNGDISFRDIF